jgi:membrane fusion protein, copper/silver efflux system
MKTHVFNVLILVGLSYSVWSQTSLDDYLKIAEQNNPGLKVRMAEFEASMQVIPQMSSLPDPEFSVSAFGQMVETRVGQQMTRLSLSQMFPWFGTLQKQKNAAALAAQAKYEAYLDTRNELFWKVRSAYYPLYELEQVIVLQRKNLEILTSYKTLATVQFQNGRGKLADALRVDIMMNDLKTEIQLLEMKRVPLRAAFNQLLNRPLDEEVIIENVSTQPLAIAISADSISNNPKLSGISKQIESAKFEEQAAIKQSMPMIGFGIDYIVTAKRPNMDFEDNGKDAYMPMVTVTLPIYRKKYRGRINETRYMQQALIEMRKETENMLHSEFQMAQYEIDKAIREWELYEQQIAQTKQVADLLLTGLGNTETDFEEILNIQQILLKYEVNKVSAIKDYHLAEARINYLMNMKNIVNNKIVLSILILVVGIFLGWVMFSPTSETNHQDEEIHSHNENEIWTCSMHPSVRQNEPGKCPLCGMDLIPLSTDEGDDPMEVKMSATAMKLANIRTMKIGTDNAVKEVRLNGKVQADERRISSQAAHIPGRIEQLLVNFTGEYVQKGTVIAYVYSPELVTAQQELFEANKIKESQPALFLAAREKLKNWKLTDKQIDGILEVGKPMEKFPLLADVSGVVLKRNASVGDYLTRGMPIYEVVDLSKVWVLFDVYESDMPWVKKNSAIEFMVQSLPGEMFKGTISFIDPLINPETRVATARVEMPNTSNKLKPEMFVTGTVTSKLGTTSELILPKSAVMWTGERSVVYLKRTSDSGVAFVMQEVLLGPSLGDGYVIREGLEPGMEVVVNGTFTIDAAAQLAGKPSMMSPEGGTSGGGHHHQDGVPTSTQSNEKEVGMISEQFKNQLAALLDPYIKLKNALVATDSKTAANEAKALSTAFGKINMTLLKPVAHDVWMPLHADLKKSIENVIKSQDVEEQRKSFSIITNTYFKAINTFKLSGLDAYYQFCPMAFNDKGGFWISKSDEIENPYFGSKMMRCGEVVQEIN